MITVLSGTNRPGSQTKLVAEHYFSRLQAQTSKPVKFFSLEDIPEDLIQIEMYSLPGQSSKLANIQDEYMISADKLVVVAPEYNGSFPGILKLFLDACSIRDLKPTFKGKKVALVGVASGRAGNIRGMDHLTGIFHYLGSTVLPLQLPISQIYTLKNEQGEIVNEDTLAAIDNQIQEFLAF